MSIKQVKPTTISTYILKFCHKFNLTAVKLLIYDGESSRQGEIEEYFEEIEEDHHNNSKKNSHE